MMALNKVVLISTLPEEPKLTYTENGTSQCSSTLLIEDEGSGHTFRFFNPVDAYGDRAEKVAEAVSAG